MSDFNYCIVDLKLENNINPRRYIEDIKSAVNATNYKLNSTEEFERILLNSVSTRNISLIVKNEKHLEELVDYKYKSIKEFISNLDELHEKDKFKIANKIFAEMGTTEMVANKIIMDMKARKKLEFDLVSSMSFNETIQLMLTEEIENEFKDLKDSYQDDNYGNRFVRRESRNKNRLDFINTNAEYLLEQIDKIQSCVRLNINLEEEIDKINKICTKLKQPINYIISAEHLDLFELEIANIILSEQYKCNIFKKPQFDLLNLSDLIYGRNMYGNGEPEEIYLDFSKKDVGLIIKEVESIEKMESSDIKRLISLINREKVTFILQFDKSKISNMDKFNENLEIINKSIICRNIEIGQGTSSSYSKLIINEINKLGYKLSESISLESITQYYKYSFGEDIMVSKAEYIANYIILQHELHGGGEVIEKVYDGTRIPQKEDSLILETGLEKLDKMVGLNRLKDSVNEFIALYKINNERKKLNIEVPNICMNIVLKGNPGTGKTTFARILAQIMKEEGLIQKGQVVEVSRDDLIAKYVGWTAKTITNFFEKAKGGILFIDEAYLLDSDFKDGYGEEAIGTIVRNMENYREHVIVVMAGYPIEMEDFISANPGMASRIGLNIEIEDYNDKQLFQIFQLLCEEKHLSFDEDVSNEIKKNLSNAAKSNDRNYGNGRYIRKMYERILLAQAIRLGAKRNILEAELLNIEVSDVAFLKTDSGFQFYNNRGSNKIGFHS